MKITTEDCIKAIVTHLIKKENNFTDPKNWKRISKSGTGDNIIRKFQNKVSNREIYVKASDSEIFEVSDKEFDMITKFKKFSNINNEFKDFPFVKECEFATIYSKNEIEDWEIRDEEFSDYEDKYTTNKGTRIGIIQAESNEIDAVIVVKKDMNRVSDSESYTYDQVIYFEVEKNKYYSPAQEPQDILDDDSILDDMYDDDDSKILKKGIKKYKLDHLLLSM